VSFILDALRKAEQERRAFRAPTLATAHAVPARYTVWPWIAGAVAVGAVLLVLQWPRIPPPPALTPAARSTPAAPTVAAGPAAPPGSPSGSAPAAG